MLWGVGGLNPKNCKKIPVFQMSLKLLLKKIDEQHWEAHPSEKSPPSNQNFKEWGIMFDDSQKQFLVHCPNTARELVLINLPCIYGEEPQGQEEDYFRKTMCLRLLTKCLMQLSQDIEIEKEILQQESFCHFITYISNTVESLSD